MDAGEQGNKFGCVSDETEDVDAGGTGEIDRMGAWSEVDTKSCSVGADLTLRSLRLQSGVEWRQSWMRSLCRRARVQRSRRP